MPSRKFVYKVDVDASSARSAAAKMRLTFENEFNRIRIDSSVVQQFTQVSNTAARRANTMSRAFDRISTSAQAANSSMAALNSQANRLSIAPVARGTGGGGGGGTGGAFLGLAKLGLVRFAIGQAVSAIKSMVDFGTEGANVDRLTKSFDDLNERLGFSSDTLLPKLRRAFQGTVSDFQIIASSNLLLASAQQEQMDITEEQIARLGAFARLRSTQLAQEGKALTAAEAYSRLIRGVAKRESELLDELGISTKQLAAATGRSLQEVAGSVEGMLNAVLAVADVEIAKFGDPVLDEAAKIEQAKARILNAWNEIQIATAEPILLVVSIGAGISEGLASFVTDIKDEANLMRAAAKDVLADMGLQRARNILAADQAMLAQMQRGAGSDADIREMQAVVREDEALVRDLEKAVEDTTDAFRELQAIELRKLFGEPISQLDPLMEMAGLDFSEFEVAGKQLTTFQQIIADFNASGDVEDMISSLERLAETQEIVNQIGFITSGEAAETRAVAQLNEALGFLDEAQDAGAQGADELRAKMSALADEILLTGEVTEPQIAIIQALTAAVRDLVLTATGVDISSSIKMATGKVTLSPEGRAKEEEELRKTRLRNEKEAFRLQQETARKAQSEWEKAAREAQRAWEKAIQGIPGMPGQGRSPVTEPQLQAAKAGLPQNFMDDFLRRAQDELINKVDWPTVDPQEIAELLGLPSGLPSDVLFGELEKSFTSGAFFALPEVQANIDKFLNFEAAEAELKFRKAAEEGVKFIEDEMKKRFGSDFDYAGVGDEFASGFSGAFAGGENGVDIAGPTMIAIDGQFANMKGFDQLGETVASRMFIGFGNNVAKQPWAMAIADSIQQDIMEELEALIDARL